MLIVIVSFLILGAMVFAFVSSYWRNEKLDIFLKNTTGIADIAKNDSAVINDRLYFQNPGLMEAFINTFASNMNAEIFITDTNGNIIMFSQNGDGNYYIKQVPQDIMNQVLNGQYDGDSTLGGIYSSSHYVVGIPIKISTELGNVITGAVFACVGSESFSAFQKDILKLFLISAALAIIISFISVSRLSYSLVKPIRQISDAAVCMGRGDFSRRVSVNSGDEIQELADAFNNMASSLCSSESVRRSFIANVSHEFKTPMTTIAGFIDGILDGTIPEDQHKKYLNTVSSEIKRLSRLVKTMLDLSRIDNEELSIHYTCFNITDVILRILISFENKINGKYIDIKGIQECSALFVDGDPDMMYQVFYNLIENAIKFTNQSGYIKIDIEDINDVCNISIENSGHGIAKDEIEFIFDRFYKTDKSRSEDKNGMGLGLYIVKKILNLHGGDISVLSKQDNYTRFDITIPKYKNRVK